jgi:NTE family protein
MGPTVQKTAPRIGLALGGGGAKGFAHVPILEALDEMGLRPSRIVGTSIGAVIGALYASGLSGRAIRETVDDLVISEEDDWREILFGKDLGRIADLVRPGLMRGSLLHIESFLQVLAEHLPVKSFKGLKTPLQVVASDYWSREQVVLERGALLPAIGASVALPGLFKPYPLGQRLLLDGGMVNPVPFDLLAGRCDITVAVDVLGERNRREQPGGPPFFETLFTAFQIMQQTILNEKLEQGGPDIYLRIPLRDIKVLDFHKVDEIYRQAAPAKAQLQWELERLLT